MAPATVAPVAPGSPAQPATVPPAPGAPPPPAGYPYVVYPPPPTGYPYAFRALQSHMTVTGGIQIGQADKGYVIGVAPLLLANAHWLDQPEHRKVVAHGVRGEDRVYPGFVGADLAFGVMFDVRFWELVGVEVDLIYQNDRGSGTVVVKDRGSICFVPGTKVTYPTDEYELTIGQYAWHVPLLLKLSVPGLKVTVDEGQRRKVIRKSFTTFAAGPELVFPERATFKVSPSGLAYPQEATASTYVMYTGAIGWERRLADSYDIRLIGSLRGSFNPEPKDSAPRRGRYDVVDGEVVPVSYKSEWRYQVSATVGLGLFF